MTRYDQRKRNKLIHHGMRSLDWDWIYTVDTGASRRPSNIGASAMDKTEGRSTKVINGVAELYMGDTSTYSFCVVVCI